MTFPEAIRDGFAKYVTFRGRSSRPAYWWWYLFTLLAYIVAAVIDQVIGTFVITVIVSLALVLPNLAVLVRPPPRRGPQRLVGAHRHPAADRLHRAAHLHADAEPGPEQVGRGAGHRAGELLSRARAAAGRPGRPPPLRHFRRAEAAASATPPPVAAPAPGHVRRDRRDGARARRRRRARVRAVRPHARRPDGRRAARPRGGAADARRARAGDGAAARQRRAVRPGLRRRGRAAAELDDAAGGRPAAHPGGRRTRRERADRRSRSRACGG